MNKHYLLKNHSALMIAPTENLLEYKIVERKMAHLFYLGEFYLALLVYPRLGPQSGRHDFRGEKNK